MNSTFFNWTACPLAATLIAATLSLPTWAQNAQVGDEVPLDRVEIHGINAIQDTAEDAAEAVDDLYAEPDPRDRDDDDDDDNVATPLPQDLPQLPLGEQIPLQAGRASTFNFRAQKPGMMTLLVAGLGDTPSMRIEARNGALLQNGQLDASVVRSLQRQNNFNPQEQNYRGYGEATYGLAGNASTAWLLVHIPQAGDYTIRFAVQDGGTEVIDDQPVNRRWAIPITELNAETDPTAEGTGAEASDEPTPYARVEFVQLLDAQDIQAEQLLLQQQQERERQQRQQRLLQMVQNAPVLESGTTIEVEPNSWVSYTAPAGGFLVVTGMARNNDLRFAIHRDNDLENYIEYIDEDRDRNAGSEAIIFPLTADQQIYIHVRCSRGGNNPVRLRTHFEPNAAP